MGRVFGGLLLLVALVGKVEAGVNGVLSFPLELDETRCFYEEVDQTDSRVYIHTQITDGGFDLKLEVTGPYTGDLSQLPTANGNVIFSDQLDTSRGEKRLLFRSSQGDALYKVCVTNGGVMMKAISLVVRSAPPTAEEGAMGPVKPMEPIRKTIVRISEALMNIQEDQQWLKTKERVQRAAVEDACVNVVFWSVASVIMLLGIGGSQIWYYNNLFKEGKGGSRGRGA
eukprot:Hpha_TRINITY_DN12276_c0_g1::TRINITY_DN12276_c0_g1_i1::g.16745::m.16745/K20347/TMED2, EMP24; p24 family protein beta-1